MDGKRIVLPGDAMCKSGLCCSPVYVCLSITLVHCIHTAKDIIILLSRPSSTIILVFWLPVPVPISNGNPFSGGTKYKGLQNFAIFDWNRRLSQKWCEIGQWFLWNVNRKSYALCQMVTFSVTLTGPWRGFQVVAFLKSVSQKRCVLGTKSL